MRMRLSIKKVACAAFALALGAAVLAGCSSNDNAKSDDAADDAKQLTVETDLADMTWDQVLEEAKGQTVTFCAWDTDVMVKQWWDYLAEEMKEKYDITLQYVPDDAANEEKILTDIQNGSTATIDLFWGMGAATAKYRAEENGVFSNWVSALPNSAYLDQNDNRNTFDGTANTDNEESPFQTLNPSLVFSADKWDLSLPWDGEKDGKKGLFHNFTELASWVQLNPGQFTYMDLNGSGTFHSKCFLKAILADLTDDGNGGWKAVYDESDDAETRHAKILAHNEEWSEWLASSEASEEAFIEKASYLWAYLNDLTPYLLQGDNGALYPSDAVAMRGYQTSGDLACTFTTCTTISSRIEADPSSYVSNPQIYMLQTSIGMWDYVIITGNSAAKAAAMVVANEMIDPAQQAHAYALTGNGYNVSYDLLSDDQKKAFDDVVDSFLPGTSPTVEEVANDSYGDITGGLNAWLVTGWDTKVNQA